MSNIPIESVQAFIKQAFIDGYDCSNCNLGEAANEYAEKALKRIKVKSKQCMED